MLQGAQVGNGAPWPQETSFIGQGLEAEDVGLSFVITSSRSWQITKKSYFVDNTKHVIRSRIRGQDLRYWSESCLCSAWSSYVALQWASQVTTSDLWDQVSWVHGFSPPVLICISVGQREGWWCLKRKGKWTEVGTERMGNRVRLSSQSQGQCQGIPTEKIVRFPSGRRGKESTCQCRTLRTCGFHPWVGEIPWRRAWLPSPGFLPGESYGQRSLTGYRLWNRGSQTQLWHTHTHTHTHTQKTAVINT